MKTFIIAIVVLLIIVTGGTCYKWYLNKVEEELSSMLDEISDMFQSEDWDKISNKTEEVSEKWEKNEAYLSMFNDHEDVDDIRLSISNLKESIRYQDKEHSQKAVEETKILLNRLRKNETLSLENILGLSPSGLSCHIML